jgi:opacity protein-like surface antigen
VLAVIAVLVAAVADAQPLYSGMLTGHIGSARQGDVRESGTTLGASMSVIEASGIGAELDLGHTLRFDESRFTESGITTLMLNVVGYLLPVGVRPYVGAGVGLIRTQAETAVQPVVSRTDWGFDAGGGVLYMFNEAFGARAEARYFRNFQRQTDLPVLDNGFFDFWRVSVGATFIWPIR